MEPCRCVFVIPVCENEEDHRRRMKEEEELEDRVVRPRWKNGSV